MKIVLDILNLYVKKARQIMILKMNTTLPCMQFQATNPAEDLGSPFIL